MTEPIPSREDIRQQAAVVRDSQRHVDELLARAEDTVTHNRTESAAERSSRARNPLGESPAPPGGESGPQTAVQPSDRITLNRSQLAALLAHHADVLASNLRSNKATGLAEHYLGMGRAASLLDLHANALTADEETPDAAELLDAILTFPTGQPDQADAQPSALRDRIAATMREHHLVTNRTETDADGNMPCRCGDWREPGPMGSDGDDWDTHLADAVLAVLPDHAAVRAAALNEGADAIEADNACTQAAHREYYAKLLRRLAAAARPDDTTGAR